MVNYFTIGKNDVSNIYSRIRTTHERELVERRRKLYTEWPELAEMDRQITEANTRTIRKILTLSPSEAEKAKMLEITTDSALNDPASLPKPILQKLIDKAVADKCENSTLRNIAQSSAKTMTKTVEDTADVLVNGKVCEDNFTLNKTVQLNGGKEWLENVTAKAGDTVRYRIQFKNTGNTTLKNVVIRDILPQGMSYKKGTTILYNAENTKGKKLGDGIVTADGINIGDYAKGTEATVYFYATVNASLEDNCYDSTLTNVAKGKYNNDSKTEKSDTAKVSVKGQICKDPDLPKTGATTIATGIFGTAAVATAAGYYIVSRKKLN